MNDLSVFSNNSTVLAPKPVVQEKKVSKSGKLGGQLAPQAKGAGSLGKPLSASVQIKNIDVKLGAGFSTELLARISEAAEEWEGLFSQEEQLEMSLTIGAQHVKDSGRAMGRQKAQLKIKYQKLIQLKTDADQWIDNDFETCIHNLSKMGLTHSQITKFAVDQAAHLYVRLNLTISDDGSFKYDSEFTQQSELDAVLAELTKLEVEI